MLVTFVNYFFLSDIFSSSFRGQIYTLSAVVSLAKWANKNNFLFSITYNESSLGHVSPFSATFHMQHGRPQSDTVFQTWSNLGLCTLASLSGNAVCTPWFHLTSCHWLKFLCWTRWSHDQVITWSVIKWPVCSSVESNWWSAAVQNKSLGLVHKCMTLNFILFFSFHWYHSSPQGQFFFCGITVQSISVLTTSPSFVPSLYFITTFLLLVPRSGM